MTDELLNGLQQSRYVPERCIATSEKSRLVFETIVSTRLTKQYTKTDLQEDIVDHIDYHINLRGTDVTVDIKSAKKFFDNENLNLDDEWIWVELKNVNGFAGWLYGKAHYVVYVFANELWFLNRKKLVDFVNRRVEKTFVVDKRDSCYKLYRRKNRLDVVTQIKLGDVRKELSPIVVKGV